MYNVWNKMKPESKVALEQADYYLKKLMNYENSDSLV
jgi:deoxyribodipyrimidine photolyase-related protein